MQVDEAENGRPFEPGRGTSVAAAVERIVADAASADTLPVFVLYGITDRDCGGQSAGGLPSSAYLDWVTAVADGLGDRTSVVVLEPDSLALALECGDPEARVRGFATNVSNTQHTADELDDARRLSTALGGANAIIDTSRNGAGPASAGAWCNPPDRALGEPPRAADDPAVDALLWVKPPGESDGTCNGGPPAGLWWAEQAIGLVENAGR